MSKQTIIDWQASSLVVASCSGRGAGVRLDRISRQRISPEDESASKTASQALTKAVNELGVGKSEATVLASRELVEVRTVNVPRMDSHELPDVIRFQAQRQLANMSDNWTLDFVMLPQDPHQEMQTALVGAISPTDMSALSAACDAANLQLTHIALAPVEIARYALSAGNLSEGPNLVVCLSEDSADLLVLKAGKVVLVRGTKLPSERERLPAVIVGEVRRSLMASSSQLAESNIEKVLILASPALATLVEQPIADAVQAPVEIIDPTSLLPESLDDREQIANELANRIFAIAGATSLPTADKSTVIDFADPKRRPPAKSHTLSYILAAAATIALLVAGFSWWISTNRALDDELAFHEQQIEDKQVLIESAKKKMAQLNEIEYFLDRAPNFLDEFTYIARRIPPSERVLLGGPMCTILPDGRAQIQVPVAADEDTTISEFEETLRDDNHEVVRRDPQRIDGATGLYAWQTVETIKIADRGWNLLDDGATQVSADSSIAADEQEPADDVVADSETAADKAETAASDTANDEATESTDKPAVDSLPSESTPVPDDGKQANANAAADSAA